MVHALYRYPITLTSVYGIYNNCFPLLNPLIFTPSSRNFVMQARRKTRCVILVW